MALPTSPLTGRPLADVAVYSVQRRKGERNKRPWIVRWSVNHRQRSRAFRTRAEAERYRSALLVAQQRGEAFDASSGEPVAWQPLPDEVRAHQWARRWLAEQWPEWAPRTRASAVEALSRLVPLLAAATAPPPPPRLRTHLASTLRPGGVIVDTDAEQWLELWSLQLRQLSRALLATVDQSIAVGDSGDPLGAATAGRYRKVSRACIRRARRARNPRRGPVAARAAGTRSAKVRSHLPHRCGACAARSRHDGEGHRSDWNAPARKPHVPGDDGRRVLRRATSVRGHHAQAARARTAKEGLGSRQRHRSGCFVRRIW